MSPMQRRSAATSARSAHALRLGALYDDHGSALFGLALAVSRNPTAAGSAVVEAFHGFNALPSTQAPGDERRDLATLIIRACRTGCCTTNNHEVPRPSDADPAHPKSRWDELVYLQRELFGLVIHGGQTYREAATTLGLDPDHAAELIRTTLLDLGEPCGQGPGEPA